jgi:hypothetical protein
MQEQSGPQPCAAGIKCTLNDPGFDRMTEAA